MSWIVGLAVGWFLYHWLTKAMEDQPTPAPAAAAPMPGHLSYAFDDRRNWALSLAHPMALARVRTGFASPHEPVPREELLRSLRPALLHLFGLRADMDDAQVRAAVTAHLGKRWFRIDLDALRAQDDPRDAMAFACARVAFAARVAGALGWVDEATQWSVLFQNAQRANDCFSGWRDYGRAWARGRKQWVAGSRADSLGVSFDEGRVEQWLFDPAHPWSALPWNVPPLFIPAGTGTTPP